MNGEIGQGSEGKGRKRGEKENGRGRGGEWKGKKEDWCHPPHDLFARYPGTI